MAPAHIDKLILNKNNLNYGHKKISLNYNNFKICKLNLVI